MIDLVKLCNLIGRRYLLMGCYFIVDYHVFNHFSHLNENWFLIIKMGHYTSSFLFQCYCSILMYITIILYPMHVKQKVDYFSSFNKEIINLIFHQNIIVL